MSNVHRLRHIFVQHGACTPLRRISSPKPFFAWLPSSEDLKELEQKTILLPRLGDGFYAPAPTIGDRFPWGQLTAQGLRDMKDIGRSLATPCPGRPEGVQPENLLIRTVGNDACVQSASAMAVGIADASGSSHVSEVLMQNQDELYPSMYLGEPDFPTAPAATADSALVAENVEVVHTAAAAAVHAVFAEAPCDELTDICRIISSLGDGIPINPDLRNALGSLTFALWAAPFHANPACAGSVLGALLRDILGRMDKAALDQAALVPLDSLAEEGDPSTRLFVVPPETLIVLAATLGYAPEMKKISHEDNAFDVWPVPGSRLEMELVVDREGVPCIHVTFNGKALTECLGRELLQWSTFRSRISPFLD